MPSIIIYESKNVKANGLDHNNQIDQNKLKEYFFEDDFEALSHLNNFKIPFNQEDLTLLYPGSGADIFLPLIYLQKLFPQIKGANLTFVDLDDNLGIIKTILDQVGISFSQEEKNKISFYWENKLINLTFITKKIEHFWEEQPSFDIYFERAFRLMRDHLHNYEEKVYQKLNQNGILISDSGFLGLNLTYLDVPKNLSSYGEMVIGIKKEKK